MGFRSIGSAGTILGGESLQMQPLEIEGISPIPANRGLTSPVRRRFSSGSVVDSGRTEGKNVPAVPKTVTEVMQEEGQANRDLITKLDEKNARSYRNEKLLLAGAQFGLDIMNASTQYRNVEGQARFAIMQSKNQAADALYRGRQAALETQSQGTAQGEEALLALAAQGQDVQGSGVQRVVRSYEAIAEQNAAVVEANAMREALGFELDQIATDYQLENARINRNQQYISSAFTLGAQAAGAFV